MTYEEWKKRELAPNPVKEAFVESALGEDIGGLWAPMVTSPGTMEVLQELKDGSASVDAFNPGMGQCWHWSACSGHWSIGSTCGARLVRKVIEDDPKKSR